MNCELAHERIVLAVYGELPDDAAHELERHLATCGACGEEREHLRAVKLLADAYPVEEPPANLVARSRIRLEEALDALPPKRWFERVFEKFRNNAASLQAAPVAACLLLLIGAGAGSVGGFRVAQGRAAKAIESGQNTAPAPVSSETPGVRIANVSSIVRQPNTELVDVRYNQLVPQVVRGSLHDPQIRALLVMASEDPASVNVRDDSVGLLADECRAGHNCLEDGIREALILSLRFDRDAGVRQKALEGLQPYVGQDMQVRNAVLESLLNDDDPRIRKAAINMLVPVEADTSVKQVLRSVANSDSNPQIRLASRQELRRVPEFQ